MHSDNLLTSSLFTILRINIFRSHNLWSPKLLFQNKSLKCFTLSNLDSCTHMLDIPFFFKDSAPSLQGTVISPSMDPSMSLQPTSLMAPLAQQMSHLSLGSTGTVRDLEQKMNRRLTQSIVSTLYTACFIWIFLTAFCSSWLLARLCKEHTYRNMHTCRHQLFL